MGAGSQDGSKLIEENIGIAKAVADCPETHEGVFLLFSTDRIKNLVTSKIKRSNRDRQFFRRFDDFTVLLILIIFGRNLVFS